LEITTIIAIILFCTFGAGITCYRKGRTAGIVVTLEWLQDEGYLELEEEE
jgi:hypothetical protein